MDVAWMRDDDAAAALADHFDILVRQADDGGHGAGNGGAALLHLRRPDGDQPESVLEGHGAGDDQGGEFTEGMARHHVGTLQAAAEGEDDAVEEDGGLGDMGRLQILFRPFEHDVRDPEAEDAIGPFQHVAGGFRPLI